MSALVFIAAVVTFCCLGVWIGLRVSCEGKLAQWFTNEDLQRMAEDSLERRPFRQ